MIEVSIEGQVLRDVSYSDTIDEPSNRFGQPRDRTEEEKIRSVSSDKEDSRREIHLLVMEVESTIRDVQLLSSRKFGGFALIVERRMSNFSRIRRESVSSASSAKFCPSNKNQRRTQS